MIDLQVMSSFSTNKFSVVVNRCFNTLFYLNLYIRYNNIIIYIYNIYIHIHTRTVRFFANGFWYESYTKPFIWSGPVFYERFFV